MSKPSILQKLKSGLILCKSNFQTFVETFNWMVDFCNNLKGDADVQGQKGKGLLTVDRTDESHPVIRFDATSLSVHAEQTNATVEDNSCWCYKTLVLSSLEISSDIGGEVISSIVYNYVPYLGNCYYQVGGTMKEYALSCCLSGIMSDLSAPEHFSYHGNDRPYVYLQIGMCNDPGYGVSAGVATIETAQRFDSNDYCVPYSGGDGVMEKSRDPRFYIKPLYKFTHDMKICADYRNMLQIASLELNDISSFNGD